MNEILLNMIPSSYIPEVHLSQYDVGRNIQFKLMDGNSEYSVPSGANIKILATKPSGLGFEVACTFSGNIVTLVNTETMSNESGRFRAELRITSGNVILGTSNFIMNVERSPHPEGTIDGDAETLLPELTLLVERIEDSNARIESMTASATPLPSGQNPTATYDSTTNNLDLGIPVADRQYITVDGVNYAITSITKTVVDEVSGLLVAYGTDSTVFIPDGVGVKNVAQILQAQINGKVSAVKLNGDILTPHYDSSFGDGVVDLGTISDDTKADAIVKTASGSIASFSDGGDDMPMKSLKVNIVPKQSGSGDPSPSNIRAISGWDAVDVLHTGKNLFNKNATNTANGYVSGKYLRGSNGAVSSDSTSSVSEYIEMKPNTQYTVSGTYGTNPGVCFYDSNKTFISGQGYNSNADNPVCTFTTPSGTVYARFSIVNDMVDRMQLEVGSTATDYEPYEGSTVTTNLGQTVYGGTLDVVSGKGTITMAMVDLGSLTWRWSGNNEYFVTEANLGAKMPSDINIPPVMLSEKYRVVDAYNLVFNTGGNYDKTASISSATSYLLVRDSTYSTPEAFKTAMNGVKLVYELATPTEIQLTPQEVKSLLGSNNVWSESGTVEVEYRADTTLAYNELLSLIANM